VLFWVHYFMFNSSDSNSGIMTMSHDHPIELILISGESP